jgi:Tol biopolymer transport system component
MYRLIVLFVVLGLLGCAADGDSRPADDDRVRGELTDRVPLAEVEADVLSTRELPGDHRLPGESHLVNVQMLTFGGQNAEAYWSFDDRYLIMQSTRNGAQGNADQCDQIFIMEVETGETTQVTTTGRATCAYFLPRSDRILYASTHATDSACPPEPDRSQGYVWPLYPSYEIYTAERDGSGLVNITNSPGYDAEATVSLDGRIVFTSVRGGDLDLWSMNADGSDLTQLTDTPGYDGGAFFSTDGTKICWRASRFTDKEEEQEYFRLLERGLVRPSQLEIFVADADGSNAIQLTWNGKANFGPFFLPDSSAVIFSSNQNDERGRIFDLWKIDVTGGNPEQVTFNDSFDGFPMFSWDGRRIAFSSNRDNAKERETNVFVADWLP